MAPQGRELLGEHYDRGHLTHDEVRDLGPRAAKEDGGPVPREEFRGRVFRFANHDGASGYPEKSTEETGQSTALTDPRRARREDRTSKLPDGYWRVERSRGLLPPMIGVYKRVRGERGETWAGPLLRWPFRLEDRAGYVDMIYGPPFSFWVDELRPETAGLWLGTATLAGRPVGSFRMVRVD